MRQAQVLDVIGIATKLFRALGVDQIGLPI